MIDIEVRRFDGRHEVHAWVDGRHLPIHFFSDDEVARLLRDQGYDALEGARHSTRNYAEAVQERLRDSGG